MHGLGSIPKQRKYWYDKVATFGDSTKVHRCCFTQSNNLLGRMSLTGILLRQHKARGLAEMYKLSLATASILFLLTTNLARKVEVDVIPSKQMIQIINKVVTVVLLNFSWMILRSWDLKCSKVTRARGPKTTCSPGSTSLLINAHLGTTHSAIFELGRRLGWSKPTPIPLSLPKRPTNPLLLR